MIGLAAELLQNHSGFPVGHAMAWPNHKHWRSLAGARDDRSVEVHMGEEVAIRRCMSDEFVLQLGDPSLALGMTGP
jgi:hypothetical protein